MAEPLLKKTKFITSWFKRNESSSSSHFSKQSVCTPHIDDPPISSIPEPENDDNVLERDPDLRTPIWQRALRPNGVESVCHQQAQHRTDSSNDNSGFEIKVHQTTSSDSKMRNSTVSQKLSSGTSLQVVNPIFTSISPAKDLRKSLSIADVAGLEKDNDNKKKGTMLMSDEKFTLAMVSAEDERSKIPLRHPRPLYYVALAPNINEKSYEFIRSRKEAMRRSQSLA